MVYGTSAGYVFLCSDTTESECITKGLFGASVQNFEQHIGPETKLFLYSISTKHLKGLWSPRGNAGESIDPTAFNGSFKAQLAVLRISHCTPAPLIKIQGIVNFYRPGRFQQHLTAQQVAALSLLLSLKPLRPTLTAPQSTAEPAKPSMAAPPKPSVAEQPSASCQVTQPAPVKAAPQSSAAAGLKASGNTQAAALEKAPRTSAAVSSATAVAPAKDSGTSQPFAFQVNGLKGKAGNATGGGQHKRRLSLAAVLDDVFEEVLSTPRSGKKRRRLPAAQLAKPSEPAEQPLQPIDLTDSPAKERQAAPYPAHAPMSPIDLTGSGAKAVPAPADPARKRVRKWDQMPASMQNSAAAVQQEAAKAPPEPMSKAPIPGVSLKAAQKLPAQPSSCPKPHEDTSQQREAPTSQVLEPSKALQAKASAGTAPEASELPVKASVQNEAAQVQKNARVAPDAAKHPPQRKASTSAAPEAPELPEQASAADQAGHVQKSPSVNSKPESKPLPAKVIASTASGTSELPLQASAPDKAAQVQNSASLDPDPESAAVKPLVPGCALICACSAQEADESFNRHQLPLPQKLRDAHPKAVIRQGLRVFLHNADTRRLLGPFYAKQAKGSDEKVLVTEKEPVQALKEVDVLAKLTPRMDRLADLGPVTEPSMTQQICKAFQEAAIPNRIQPYRMLGGNLGGAVFVCSAGTVQSCLQKGLLGMMQDTFIPIVQHVSLGMPVFLFNHSDRTLLGPLSAVSPGGMYLEERAWARPGHKSPWPAQVRVAVHHPVIALQEKVFKPLLDAAYYSANNFHFDLTKAEALSLLEAFTHRQVMYHQHLQHRQGHAYFVPPAMCQQLLEVARRASRPPQQPARPNQAHTNAYLAVLESGLSTQKKPAKRPEEDATPEPPPLEEILGREPGELEPGELQAPGAERSLAEAAAAGDALPAPAQQQRPSVDAASGSAAAAEDRSQQISSADAPPLPDSLSAQSNMAKQSPVPAAHDQSVQPAKEPKTSSSLLEKFDAARQQHSGGSGVGLAPVGAPAVGAKPAIPSPLGRQLLPMLSPLVLSTAPHHTPMQAHASSAPAAQDQGFSFGQHRQLQPHTVHTQLDMAAGQTTSEVSLAQSARPEQNGDAQPAEPNSFSFAMASAGQPPSTPPSFVKLLQEYGSTSGKPPAPEQPEQPINGKTTAHALKRRRARIRKLKEAVCAAAAKEAESAQETSEESAAEQSMPSASTKLQPTHAAEALELAAINRPTAASSAQMQAISDGNASAMAAAQATSSLQLTPSNGRQQHSNEPNVSAVPARSMQVSPHDKLSAPKQASPDMLLRASLGSFIQEAAQSGTKLSASRRSQLADTLQDAALAASQLHLALQSASAILRSEPEAEAPISQDVPVGDSGVPCAATSGREGKPGSSSMLMLTAGAEKQAAVPLKLLSKAAAPALQLNASKKRSRLSNESSAAADSDASTAVMKKQKRSEGAAGTTSGAGLQKKARKAKQTNHQLLSGKNMPEGVVKNPAQVNVTAGQPSGIETALSAQTSLEEGVHAWRADKAANSDEISRDASSEKAVIDQAAADAPEVAVEAQPVAEADAAAIPGLAAEDSTSAAPNSDSSSPPPDPPPSPPAVASPPAAFTQPLSPPAQPQSYRPAEHTISSPPKLPQPSLMQQQPGSHGQGLRAQYSPQRSTFSTMQPGQPMLQAPAFGAAHQRLPPQHAPHQAGPFLGIPVSRAGRMMHGPMGSQGMQFQLAPGGNPQQQMPQLQMQGISALHAQQSSQPPWQLDMPRKHPQQQHPHMAPPQGPPPMQLSSRPALQQPFLASRPHPQGQPAPWQLQQQQSGGPGMPLQHAGQLWANGQAWAPAWQPGLPPAQLKPFQQLGAHLGQLPPPRPPAHAPPLLQPPFAPPASAQPPQLPRPEQPLVSAPLQPQTSSQPARAVQAQQPHPSSQPLGIPGQVVGSGQGASAQAAALPVNGPDSGDQGSFRFNAGKVGSAIKTKTKKRKGDLSNLQRQLEQQRAKFLQWHQRELNRSKNTGKRKTLKAKRKELEQMTQECGDPRTLEQVQHAASDALLAAPNNANGAASVSTSLAGLQLEAAGDNAALSNGVLDHTAVQMTPLGPTVGLKRKRLQNGNMLSKLVAFDTNVYMGNNAKDPKVIAQVLRAWSLISPSIVILVPIVVMSELNCLATSNNRQLSQLAAGGLKVLQSVLASKIAHVQLPEELPEGCSTNRLKDDGILDCLRHFKEAGYHIFLCTRDKQFACRSQAQGIEAIAPDLLSTRPEYPLQVEMTPLPPKKRSRSTVGAAAAAVQPAATQDIVTAQPGAVQDVATAQPGAVQDDLDAQPGALQDDFIAL